MRSAKVVIGAAFGDEGKGLMVDYFARKTMKRPIVVRFNGGAQAGHTVATPEGERHVFSHIGAGALAGADTYLSEHFIVNPHAFLAEHGWRINSDTFVHPDAMVTTPYDMFVNQKIEESRGDKRHGSCGMGIHETIIRHHWQERHQRITVDDLTSGTLIDRLIAVQNSTVSRLNHLGLLTEENERWIRDMNILMKFMSECREFRNRVHLSAGSILEFRDVIFEGAQGLLLDQSSKFFPHVTPSNTGLTNVIKIANRCGIKQLDVTYVMRSYLTRHGAGPLPGEDPELYYMDNTNIMGPWQGHLRFAPQSDDLVFSAIQKDLESNSGELFINPGLAVTHLDQKFWLPKTDHFRVMYTSTGPTHKDVISANSE